jgi:hypothetical protein
MKTSLYYITGVLLALKRKSNLTEVNLLKNSKSML